MLRLILPVILQYSLGEKVCERIRTQVGEERWGDNYFVHKLILGNKNIMRAGRELGEKYKSGEREGIDRTEARLGNLISAQKKYIQNY